MWGMGAQRRGVGSQLPPAPTEFNPWPGQICVVDAHGQKASSTVWGAEAVIMGGGFP